MENQEGIEFGDAGIVVGDFCFAGVVHQRKEIKILFKRRLIPLHFRHVLYEPEAVQIGITGLVATGKGLQELIDLFVGWNCKRTVFHGIKIETES